MSEERFLGGEVIEDPAVIVQHNYWRDAAWHHAVRRDDFATEELRRPQRPRGAPRAGQAAPRASPAGRADRQAGRGVAGLACLEGLQAGERPADTDR